jgi:general secretion pathway protein J
LLETLVVLVLVAIIASILVDGTSRIGDVRQRLATRVEAAGERAMRIGWFRQSIEAAMPDLPDGDGIFRGDAQALTLRSAMPLRGRAPTTVHWRVVEAAPRLYRLETREADGDWVETLSWRDVPGRFAFLDPAGGAHATWPDAEGASQLPAAILLQTGVDGRTMTTVASVAGARNVPPHLLEQVRR